MSINETGLGGFKEATATIAGQGRIRAAEVRVRRSPRAAVPETEASGRIHTSAATVAVLPEAEDVDVHIEEKDLRIDVYRSSGPGRPVGQHDRQRRAHHPPADRDRRDAAGREVAAQEPSESDEDPARPHLRPGAVGVAAERAAERKSQVGSGDRSERIRTYNFPQERITDHRVNLTLHKLDRVLGGELDEILDALIADDQANRLAEAV